MNRSETSSLFPPYAPCDPPIPTHNAQTLGDLCASAFHLVKTAKRGDAENAEEPNKTLIST